MPSFPALVSVGLAAALAVAVLAVGLLSGAAPATALAAAPPARPWVAPPTALRAAWPAPAAARPRSPRLAVGPPRPAVAVAAAVPRAAQPLASEFHRLVNPFVAFCVSTVLAFVAVHRRRFSYAAAPADPLAVAMAATAGRKAPVVIAPSYNLAVGTAAVAGLLAALPGSGLADIPAVVFGLLAALFAVQTGRVKFCFDDEALELRLGEELRSSGENIVVGGANRWNYRTFVNWDIFPSRSFPILVYFKETQTPKEQWGTGPGQLDKVGGGQIHFFPAVCNVEQICEQFETRGCRKVR